MKTILAAGPRAGFRRDRLHGFQVLAPIDSVPLLDLLGSGDASVPAWKQRRYHCSQSCGVVEIEGLGPDYGVRVRQYLAAGFPSGVGRSFDAGACPWRRGNMTMFWWLTMVLSRAILQHI